MRMPASIVSSVRPAFEGRAACVTGGAGFIGSHLVDALVSLGATVTVIDDLSNSSLDHLSELIEMDPAKVRFVHGSILDDRSLTDAVRGAHTVFHLAAMGSVTRSIEEPRRAFTVNAAGTVAVLEAARAVGAAGGARVVFASSSSVYGSSDGDAGGTNGTAHAVTPRSESMPPLPLSPYAASKLAAEAAVRSWSKTYNLPAISLRFFNVFGPRQSAQSQYAAVIAAFAKRLLAGEPPVIFGDGTQSRDFTFVSNAVAGMLQAAALTRGMEGQAVNIATGRRVDLLELARLMAERAGMPHVKPVLASPRAGEVKHSVADISLARRVLGFQPFATLEDGLDETVRWYRQAFAGA